MSESIGHYDILGLVGTGGLGTVYRARDTKAGRTVAVRVLGSPTPDPLHRTRFIDAIRPFTALSHPHVATLFEVGEHGNRVFLVYEFVPGEKLAAQTSGRPLNLRRALDLSIQVADALAEAHAIGLVHAALTPSSIVVTPKGHAKILDFGLAALSLDADDHQAGVRLAARGAALGAGSVLYMSPEQVLGQAVDPRTDVFALGAILYEALTGRPPFEASSTGDIGIKVLQYTPPAPSSTNPEVTVQLDAVVARALAKNVDDRYQSAAALAADLRAAATTAHARDAAIGASVSEPPAARSPWRMVLLGALLMTSIALAVWHWNEPLRHQWQARFGPRPAPLVVVLPFQTGGDDATRPYYGAGFAEDLSSRLGPIPGVTILGRSMIRSYAGRSAQAVARETGASLALTGRVTPSDEEWKSLQVRVNLVDRDDGRIVWSGTYTGATRDVIALQIRIAREIAGRLQIPIKPNAAFERMALRLAEPAAYDDYLRARDALASNDASRAAQLFERAVSGDPSLLEAQAGLAEALYVAATFEGRIGLAESQARMRGAAEEAVTADPDLAPAQLAMGLSAPTLRAAIEHLRRAIEIDRTYTGAYLALADLIREVDPVRSLRFSRRVLELDPGQPLAQYQLAVAHVSLGQFDEALVEIARGRALAPSLSWWDALRWRVLLGRPATRVGIPVPAGSEAVEYPPASLMRAAALQAGNHLDDAAAVLAAVVRLYPGMCEARASLAGVLVLSGKRSEGTKLAADILADADRASDPAPWARCAAMAAAAVNDAPRAAAWIARAAASEESIRLWSAANGVLSPQAGLRQKLFPWSNVAGHADVVASVHALDAALARVRAGVARLLDGLTDTSK